MMQQAEKATSDKSIFLRMSTVPTVGDKELMSLIAHNFWDTC